MFSIKVNGLWMYDDTTVRQMGQFDNSQGVFE